jgi:Zn-dependent protease with chaperone function
LRKCEDGTINWTDGIALKRGYVVPAGRGHLTNAYGLSESIAVTDNYGKFLDRAELDFVIGHELGHVKGKHGRKKLLIMTTVFAALAAICFFFPPALIRFRPLLDFLLLLIPMLTFYFFSRRFEYAADKSSVEFTHDAKAAVPALDNLYNFTEAPSRCNRITEFFLTHPALEHRAAAIGGIGRAPAETPWKLLPHLKDG